VLRDLISLTQSAIEEAYLADSDNVQASHVKAAALSLARGKLLGLSDKELEILQKVATEGKFIPRTDKDIRLLVTRRILEYEYPARRYAVHPTIIPIIQNIKV
jgi:hypothetical protein